MGDGGPISCFLCPGVCLDSVGMRVRKTCRPKSILRVCVSDGEDTHGVGASTGHVAGS